MRWRGHLIALVLAVAAVASPPASAGIVLEASTDALEMTTSTAASTDYNCSWTDSTTTAFTPGKTAGNVASAGATTTIVAAPAASTQRNVLNCTIRNVSSTTANVIGLQRDVSATNRTMFSATLAPGEAMAITQEGEFHLFTAAGIRRTQGSDGGGYMGRTYAYSKAGTAKDAAGYWTAYPATAGFPGASVPGAPGVNGWTTDCSTATNAADPAGAAQLGAHVLQDPASGNLYLTNVSISSSLAEAMQLIDVLWYNTGINVTTTTIQAITTPTFPARDLDGSTNGEGVQLALFTTTANTNAGAITNTTVNYTNSAGNTGNVATFSAMAGWQAPATPVINTWMPFRLAAGDRGVRAITNASGGGITLGTSYGAGALSLVAYRVLATIGNTVVNAPTSVTFPAPGVRVYPNSCIWLVSVGNAATASAIAGSYTIIER